MLTVLDLFSGIGGFSLGLERSGGFRTVAFCEIEPYARRVLARHWPGVPCYSDVRELSADRLEADGIGQVDVICGGFPCQDISQAGRGAGLEGERSGLWQEMRRLIGEVRPRLVLIENVAMLRSRGLASVLGSLAALGYDAEWHCIPARAVGAPHRRDRLWIVAYADSNGGRKGSRHIPGEAGAAARGTGRRLPSEPCNGREALAYADGEHGNQPDGALERGAAVVEAIARGAASSGGRGTRAAMAYADGAGLPERLQGQLGAALAATRGSGWWDVEPNVGRVADGVPRRVDRLRCLGNAVVPQIPELIGRAILAAIGGELAAAA